MTNIEFEKSALKKSDVVIVKSISLEADMCRHRDIVGFA